MCLPSDGLRPGLIAFDSTDVDTIIIKRFEKGNNFTHGVDTSQWDRWKVVFTRQNDTFQMSIFVGDILLKSTSDYQVFIPSISRTFAITEMNEPQREGNCKYKVMCGNIIVSCTLDGTPVSPNNQTLYLKK